MFQKLTAVEPVNLLPEAERELFSLAKEVVLYRDRPETEEELLRRMQGSDAVLVSYTTNIPGRVIQKSEGLRYIGMCCSLYSEQSANVDIRAARERGVDVRGIRDYGDEGVVEYVISELVRLLHGFGYPCWEEQPREITGLKVGIIGMGTSGSLIADGLRYFGAQVSYYSRTRKPEQEKKGFSYRPLPELLAENEVICTCLNKNVVLLGEAELQALGNHKILFNTGLSPSYEAEAFRRWLEAGDNHYFCDTEMALGAVDESLRCHPRVHCAGQSAGMTQQATVRLGEKVLGNLRDFMRENEIALH